MTGRSIFPQQVLPLLLFTLLLSTSESIGQSPPSLSSLQGNWKFTFGGALNGGGTLEVGAEGKISIHVSLGKYDRLFTNPITLNVSNTGALSGDIFLWLLAVGRVEGNFSPSGDLFGRVSTPLFNVGFVSGHLSENSGNGTYQSMAGNGTWNAQKN